MSQKSYQYLPVNWMDGMKINKSNFIAQDNAFSSRMMRSIGGQIHGCNYGLLPGTGEDYKGMKLFVTTDNQQQVQVRLQSCHALTSGGLLVWLEEDTMLDGFVLQAPEAEQKVLILLVINPWQRVPFGDADPEELPVRLPYTAPSYSLQLLPCDQAARKAIGPFHLVLGRLRFQAGKALLDEDYIPPCSSVSSHPHLLEVQAGIHQFFGKMESFALLIIQKILQKKQQNDLSVIIQKWCEQISVYTANAIPGSRTIDSMLPPVHLINTVAGFARLSKNILDFFTGSGKEEFINYCTEWCDVSQAELEESIITLANHPYDHLDIHDSLQKVDVFTTRITGLFKTLSRLEYIGKKKDMGIFVKEQVVDSNADPLAGKRKSFLAE